MEQKILSLIPESLHEDLIKEVQHVLKTREQSAASKSVNAELKAALEKDKEAGVKQKPNQKKSYFINTPQ